MESIEDDVASVTTVSLRLLDPDSYAPHRFHFDPGQFSWLQARRSPFSLSYHPFSISSSALHPDRIRFSIKAHEGFSREIVGLRPGDTVYVDGPFGAFVLPQTGPVVFIAAGVGVTPLLGMLETLADRGDDRECVLWLGNRRRLVLHLRAGPDDGSGRGGARRGWGASRRDPLRAVRDGVTCGGGTRPDGRQ